MWLQLLDPPYLPSLEAELNGAANMPESAG